MGGSNSKHVVIVALVALATEAGQTADDNNSDIQTECLHCTATIEGSAD